MMLKFWIWKRNCLSFHPRLHHRPHFIPMPNFERSCFHKIRIPLAWERAVVATSGEQPSSQQVVDSRHPSQQWSSKKQQALNGLKPKTVSYFSNRMSPSSTTPSSSTSLPKKIHLHCRSYMPSAAKRWAVTWLDYSLKSESMPSFSFLATST
ncbi:hypothetical protein ACFX15_022460 [Malus domestica]